MDCKDDRLAVNQAFQYMFGKAMLVAPVTEPDITNWNVYLPKTAAWYNFHTGQRLQGGQTIAAAAAHQIPVFIKAGSIIPLGEVMQYTKERSMDTLEIRIYHGADGEFNLYEDEGDGYNYEKGSYTEIPFRWKDKKQLLTIGAIKGGFPGALKKRVFNIVSIGNKPVKKRLVYTGKIISTYLN